MTSLKESGVTFLLETLNKIANNVWQIELTETSDVIHRFIESNDNDILYLFESQGKCMLETID